MLVSEGPTEQYGERRVNLLKSQVIQLERQVNGLHIKHDIFFFPKKKAEFSVTKKKKKTL